MGWIAGIKRKTDADAQGDGPDIAEAAGTESRGGKKKRGIILILLGLALTGIAASWKWLRRTREPAESE